MYLFICAVLLTRGKDETWEPIEKQRWSRSTGLYQNVTSAFFMCRHSVFDHGALQWTTNLIQVEHAENHSSRRRWQPPWPYPSEDTTCKINLTRISLWYLAFAATTASSELHDNMTELQSIRQLLFAEESAPTLVSSPIYGSTVSSILLIIWCNWRAK